jgi:hypothetical protein
MTQPICSRSPSPDWSAIPWEENEEEISMDPQLNQQKIAEGYVATIERFTHSQLREQAQELYKMANEEGLRELFPSLKERARQALGL